MRSLTLISTLGLLTAGSLAQLTDDAARCPKLPEVVNPFALPDPFTFYNGKPVRTKADWACRRAEIAYLIQRFELGALPKSKPTVKGTLYDDGKKLGVAISDGGKSIAFNVTIKLPNPAAPAPTPVPTEPSPEGIAAPARGHPAFIGLGTQLLPLSEDIAFITYLPDVLAEQNGVQSRGKGLFYELYGKEHPAGSIMAYTWGLSRIIDALEQVPDAKIDPKRLAVTGCSRYGKAVVAAGAFEERIALTIPQESGTGGAGCWRIADGMKRSGVNVQTSSQIITENIWFGTPFNAYAGAASGLPFDHHLLSALIAPRALYTPENGGIDWLGPESTWGCQSAARSVWKALGVEDRIGFEQTGREVQNSHCLFPEEQTPGLTAFVDRFLKGEKVDTSKFFHTEATFPEYEEKDWIVWDTPTLR